MSKTTPKFRWYRSRPVKFLLYLLFRVIVLVIDILPYRLAPVLGHSLGRIIRFIDRKHTRIAAINLARSRGICPADDIPAFIDRLYAHFGLALVESLMIPRFMKRQQISRYVKLKGFERFNTFQREGRGVILVIGHLGNWELIALAVCLAGYPLNSLARPIQNPWIDRYLTRFRVQTGQKIIPKHRAMGEMIRVLGRKEILVIQVDQDARRSGVNVDFFGRPATTHRSPAVLSLRFDAPIVMVNIYREGEIHHAEVVDPIYPEDYRDDPDPVRALTQAYTRQMETAIRAHPEQWFIWVHERWKTAERMLRVAASPVV